MEENTTQTTPEECAVQENKCCCKKKLSGDLRTFIIALLTSVIVVLAYHGIRYSLELMQYRNSKISCRKSFCAMQIKSCPEQHAKKEFHGKKFSRYHHLRKKEFKCSECGKKEFRRFHRKMKNSPNSPMQTAEPGSAD